jgi:anti-sigma regulatory factor (Ser/Thr protein kinase)
MAEFAIEGRGRPQALVITIADHGPGIADLDLVLRGDYRSTTGLGLGLRGAGKLMDECEVDTRPGLGTEVRL